jgi:hypothetical protein
VQRRAAVAGVVLSLAVLVTVPIVWAVNRPEPDVGALGLPSVSPSAPPADPGPTPAVEVRSATGIPSAAPEPPPPTRLVMRSIGVDTTVLPVGVAANGQVEIPRDARRVGWYRFGPAPGQPRGSVVIVGHRDSRTQGAGALFRLNEAQVGDIVALTMADGTELSYRVVERRQYEKKVLPLSQLFDWAGPARLTLVTCGGPYDKRQGGYLDNIVVTALPLDSGARP